MSIRIPTNTKMYLTNKNKNNLYVKQNTTLININLYVAYDLKINGITIIPKGTRVLGDWITSNIAQFIVHKIFLKGNGQIMSAESDYYNKLINYDQNVSHFYKSRNLIANKNQRIMKYNYLNQFQFDSQITTNYVEIDQTEITVSFTSDFVLIYC